MRGPARAHRLAPKPSWQLWLDDSTVARMRPA